MPEKHFYFFFWPNSFNHIIININIIIIIIIIIIVIPHQKCYFIQGVLYFYLILLANILNKIYFLFADRVQVGMDSDSSDPMAPDEMYLMLQADMVCTYTCTLL